MNHNELCAAAMLTMNNRRKMLGASYQVGALERICASPIEGEQDIALGELIRRVRCEETLATATP